MYVFHWWMLSWRGHFTKSSSSWSLWISWAFQALQQHSPLIIQIRCVNQGGHCSTTCYLIMHNMSPLVSQICFRYSFLWTIYPLKDFISQSYKALNLLGVFSPEKWDISDNCFSSMIFSWCGMGLFWCSYKVDFWIKQLVQQLVLKLLKLQLHFET